MERKKRREKGKSVKGEPGKNRAKCRRGNR